MTHVRATYHRLCIWRNLSCSQLICDGRVSLPLISDVILSAFWCEGGMWVTQWAPERKPKSQKPQGGSRTRRQIGCEKYQEETFTIFVYRTRSLTSGSLCYSLWVLVWLADLLLSLSSGTYQQTELWQTNWTFWFTFSLYQIDKNSLFAWPHLVVSRYNELMWKFKYFTSGKL